MLRLTPDGSHVIPDISSFNEDVDNVEIAHLQCYLALSLCVLPEQITTHHISSPNLKATVGSSACMYALHRAQEV